MNGERPTGDPIAMGIPMLVHHLRSIASSETPLDIPQVDKVSTEISFYKLPFSSNQQVYVTLLRELVGVLPRLEKDDEITAVASLVENLMGRMPIEPVMSFTTEEVLLAALSAPHPRVNLLGFEILRRAEKDLLDEVSGTIFCAALRCWLESPAVEVGQRGHQAVINLLKLEAEEQGKLSDGVQRPLGAERLPNPMRTVPRNHRLWGTFLLGEGHSLIVQACLPKPSVPYQKTSIAQVRLLGILPDVASIEFDALYAAQAPTASTRGSDSRAGMMLLWWASTDMIDKEDVAMVLVSVEFFKNMMRAGFDEEAESSRSPWFSGYISRLKASGQPAVERAARELADETGLRIARGEEGAAVFGEWLEGIWN